MATATHLALIEKLTTEDLEEALKKRREEAKTSKVKEACEWVEKLKAFCEAYPDEVGIMAPLKKLMPKKSKGGGEVVEAATTDIAILKKALTSKLQTVKELKEATKLTGKIIRSAGSVLVEKGEAIRVGKGGYAPMKLKA